MKEHTAKIDKLTVRNAQLRQSIVHHKEDNNRLATQLFFSSQMQEHLQQQLQQMQSEQPHSIGLAEGKSSEEDGDHRGGYENYPGPGTESALMDLDALLSGVVVGGVSVQAEEEGEGYASPVLQAEEDNEAVHTPVLNMDGDGSPVLVTEDDWD